MKYGFIGCGNMGSALIKALSKTTKDILVCDADIKKAQSVADEYEVKSADINMVATECERIFLGVKPQTMEQMLKSIAHILKQKKPLLITMAAGLKTSKILQFVNADMPVIRIMPNTPVSVGEGTVLYCTNTLVDQSTVDDFISDMKYAGALYSIDEQLIDAGCSVSGCGPAYMYMFIDAMAKAGAECGLTYDDAKEYAAQTMIGAAKMVLSTNEDPNVLKDKVCSPGGSTIQGVYALENADFDKIINDCIMAAFKRNKELGN